MLGDLDRGVTVSHKFSHPKHGIFVFVIRGEVVIDGKKLESGDAAAISDVDLTLTAQRKSDVLAIEVPL